MIVAILCQKHTSKKVRYTDYGLRLYEMEGRKINTKFNRKAKIKYKKYIVGVSGPVFYPEQRKILINGRRRHMCSVFSHWLRTCPAICRGNSLPMGEDVAYGFDIKRAKWWNHNHRTSQDDTRWYWLHLSVLPLHSLAPICLYSILLDKCKTQWQDPPKFQQITTRFLWKLRK